MKQGRLITNNVILERHEMSTVNFLLNYGYDIELIRPSLTPHSKNADLIMEGLVWEMKCPVVDNITRLSVVMRKATRQSPNVIVDLRRLRSDARATLALRKIAKTSRSLKRLIIISKSGEILTIKGRMP